LIFETLNDRGTPLLKADLIKNWVFQIGERVGADVEQWSETHWVDFDDEWWREEITQGRHSRSRIEYATPRMTDVAGAETLMTALRKDADTFRSFAQLSEDTPAGTFYSRVGT
jgi:hypothetical protein